VLRIDDFGHQALPGNPLLASATLDQLRHNAYCLTLDAQVSLSASG
jgi:hypothetical protein